MTVLRYVLDEFRVIYEKSGADVEVEELGKVVDPSLVGDQGSCACVTCQRACMHKPGWFVPGEAERAAEYLGLSLQEFFDSFLAADYWPEMDGEPRVLVLSPAPTYLVAGTRFPIFPEGQCVFFRHGRCVIHPAKPYECRAMLHGEMWTERQARHADAKRQWESEQHQRQITALLNGTTGKEVRTGEELKAGDHVVFVDARSRWHDALLTAVWSPECVNLVFVSGDDARRDDYGRQLERETSVLHVSRQPAPGNYWCRISEYDAERDARLRASATVQT